MEVGVFYFPTDYGINIAELAQGARGPRLRFAVRARAHAHPAQPQVALPRRRRAAQALLAHPRPVRGAGLRRGGDQEAQGRHRHLPGAAARADRAPPRRSPASTSSRAAASCSASAPAGTWTRWRTTASSYADALQPDARARAGHEGAVDQGRGRLPRQVREVRSGLVVAQAARRGRTRRSSWAARATTRCGASSTIATAGSRARAQGFDAQQAIERLHKMAEKKGRDPKTLYGHRVRRADQGRGAGRATPRPASTARCWRSPTTAATRS